MILPITHGGREIYQSESPAETLLVGTIEGAVVLRRQSGGRWRREPAPALPGRHVSVIEPLPDGRLMCGSHSHGVELLEADGSGEPQSASIGLGSLNVFCIRTWGEYLYCGTEPANLFRTGSEELHWQELAGLRDVESVPTWRFPAPPHIAHVKHLAFSPHTPGLMFASIEMGALLRSTDFGETFEEMKGINNDVHRAVFSATNPRKVWTVVGQKTVYESLDLGATWRIISGAETSGISYPDGMIVVPDREEAIVLAGSATSPFFWPKTKTAEALIVKTTDAGRTWTRSRAGLPAELHGFVQALVMHRSGEGDVLFAATTDGEIFMSPDLGDSWTMIMDGLPTISKAALYKQLL